MRPQGGGGALGGGTGGGGARGGWGAGAGHGVTPEVLQWWLTSIFIIFTIIIITIFTSPSHLISSELI